MLLPCNYNGVLLFDDNIPKNNIKLSSERKSLSKQILLLIQSNLGKHVSKDNENQRLISVFIILLNLESNNHSNISLVYKYFRLFQLSSEGKLITCKGEYKNKHKDIHLIGMDNCSNSTCYLDSLIVAMFYSNSAFDYLLDNSLDPNLSNDLQHEINRLKIILRFIINLLRSGEHININIMNQLLLILNSLGCDLALSGKQQDSLQAFEFLAESLSLPLLTLKLDIIHSGKLNVNDDLRLIGERSLLISIPTSSSSLDLPITLEECLNTYFNNSITVRRHIDQKMSLTSNPLNKINRNNNINNSNNLCNLDSPENLSDDSVINNKNDIDEYEKMGILTSSNSVSNSNLNSIPIPSSTPMNSSSPSNSTKISRNETPDSIPLTPQGSTSNFLNSSSQLQMSKSNLLNTPPIGNPSTGFENSYSKPSTPLRTTTNDSLIDFSPIMDSATVDSTNLMGSFKNVNEKLERQRTRSSTLASVLNNVQVSNPTKLTRRSSSVSNTEVSLPAWMYLQLLPYYTDPEVKLTVENHEEYYRRVSRTKTIDSTQNAPVNLKSDISSINNNDNDIEESYFNKRFGNKRPIIPICLKRYIWNERGQSIKIKRKVTIPEIIKYPYFIAEDKKKPGYVDFRRSFDHKAPRGSFMLVLQSCVCHRGSHINSGHYISIIRKKQFDISNIDSKSEWILFNDMEIGKDKAKPCSFEDAMNTETPYILFYEIYEIKNDNILIPNGGKSSYWNRKQSVYSGISGYSEQTLREEPLQDESKSSSNSTKHSMMHLSLAGLNLNKSRSKNINNDLEDVLDEFYWYDSNNFDRSLTNFKSNYSLNTNLSSKKESNTEQNSSYSASIRSSLHYNDDDDETPQVHVMEIEGSSATDFDDSNNNDNNNSNGEIEYKESLDDKESNYNDNNNNGSNLSEPDFSSKSILSIQKSRIDSKSIVDSKSIRSKKSTMTIKVDKKDKINNSNHNKNNNKISTSTTITKASHSSESSKSTKKKGSLGRKGTVKKLFKKVFSS